MKFYYKPSFVRQYRLLESALQQEVKEKINFVRSPKNQQQLKVHKLGGQLKGKYSFSVNYRYRVVFAYGDPGTVILLAVGDHAVYK